MEHYLFSNKPWFSRPTNTTRTSSRYILLCIVLAVFAIIWPTLGCDSSPNIVPVKGTVLLDGKPLEGAAVLFHPGANERPAVGITDNLGTFHLTTRNQGDGGHVGLNKVSITKESGKPSLNNAEEGIQDFTLVTPAQYASPELSGLEIDVYPEMEPVILEITSE
jgi:hypothetical protein